MNYHAVPGSCEVQKWGFTTPKLAYEGVFLAALVTTAPKFGKLIQNGGR